METFTAEDFLHPANFITALDTMPVANSTDVGGLASSMLDVTIAINDVWSGVQKDGGHVSSYERIGYHANTAARWNNFLESTATITIYRLEVSKIVCYRVSTCRTFITRI